MISFTSGHCFGYKITKHVNMSQIIWLQIYQSEPKIYDLHSIVLHNGNTVSSGHYTSNIKTEENNWFDCSVERITLQNEHELTVAQDKALLLFNWLKKLIQNLSIRTKDIWFAQCCSS